MKNIGQIRTGQILSGKRYVLREKTKVGLIPFNSCYICGRGILSEEMGVSDVKSLFKGFKYVDGIKYMLISNECGKSSYIYADEELSTEHCTCVIPYRPFTPVGTLFNLERPFLGNMHSHPFPDVYLIPIFPIYSPYFISVEKIISGKDTRTTCMLKNIPNKLNISQLIEVLTSICYNAFDFVYLRMDFKSNCNNGYAFINFREAKYIPIFLDAIQGRKWKNFKSEKKGDIAYARIQGLHMLQSRFRRSDILAADKEYWPVIFNKKGDQVLASEWKLH
ncbi:hypothetical protein NEPAR06_0873 [Nematocida parisii]|uniref:Mei2-like C-terminal RNA recognition motif domain-containing protein n=1 Tax=Nematocida parisii (strain ERTm3) TaxID=935791 RepID=I3EEQ0_NEMP3|nr:uncharacterized protein NEPG_02326 [Nematocida parisii ERTm1]EIJ87697.1 hypothetical protein NEQG_02244 [Nematocida parisii ERTm3]KAI5127728.1 hypothetical protein NEPAR03_1067 [Nematocida parisii]EIJ92927.1 hypothetical protein NEPG_02326 [Nematocida parisii ERTm1]KAI5128902.1 hypothetical protein NEPAR08_1389 [Nematocida parisii]KAI5141569.1 hypothetical protein NEPAR04_1059 [Nematocida parisii]|eukprot:XP_013060153.1 hypothetical protein NEPG_02326 [Nematocida parisii ERTm1]